jgi:hypothetical protein
MTTAFPQSQIEDAHKLEADGRVLLFQIEPLLGGVIYLKSGPEFTYLGHLYESVPISLTGERWSADNSTPTPRLTVGQPDLDLLPFKGLVFDGYLEGAKITRHAVLLDDMLNQRPYKRSVVYKVQQVENYGRTRIILVLSNFAGAVNQSFPFRQYVPPAFPWVQL